MSEQLIGPDVLASLFDLEGGPRSVNDLVQRGVITPTIVKEFGDSGRNIRKYDLIPVTRQYIRYLRELANRKGQGSQEEQVKQAEADLRFKQARAEKIELEIAELRGQMHRAEDVAALTSDMIAKLRAEILAIPGKIAVDCAEAQTPVEASAIIKAAVDDFLNETAAYKYTPADYKKLVMEREKWMGANEMENETKKPQVGKEN